MPERGLLQWLDGGGWLVFSGGDTAGSPLRAQALSRTDLDGVTIYISLADDAGEALQDDLEDLGAPTGFILDLRKEDPASIAQHFLEASLIVVETGDHLNELYKALQGAPLAAMQTAYEQGALILLEGLAVNLFGQWAMSDGGQILEGCAWVKSAFIEPGVADASESRAVQEVLVRLPEAIAIEIGVGSALALSAQGAIETWGEKQVTISLGSSYQEE